MNTVRAARLEKGQTDECLRCFYCDGLLAPSHEHDHFPVPKARGGTQVVPACSNCHDLKDRTRFGDYPMAEVLSALRELMPFYSGSPSAGTSAPELVQDMATGLDELGILLHWRQLSNETRIVYAKLTAIAALGIPKRSS